MITYSGLINYGKASMPSVESWGTNMNILKDPPKSIHTRRIDKVGTTSSITEQLDESENRTAECINVYARGVNPMVTNSLSNYGVNFNGTHNNMPSASLPYKVSADAFRAPILSQINRQPLSRQPRVDLSNFSNAAFPDFTKKILSCDYTNSKEIRTEILKSNIQPTAVYKLETPIQKPYTVKYNIQPSLNVSCDTPLSSDIRYNTSTVNTDKYIQDLNHTSAHSNLRGETKYILPMDSDIKTKDAINIVYLTPASGNTKTDYIHEEIKLDRNTPLTNYSTNYTTKGENNISNTDYKLKYTINPNMFTENYTTGTNIPNNNRIQQLDERNKHTKKSDLQKKTLMQQEIAVY